MRAKGFAVESICAVLTEQGCQVAARTYRAWKKPSAPAARTVGDAVVIDALLATVAAPESLYGRRKMTAYLRRCGHQVAAAAVDRLMRDLGMNGVVRAKSQRTTVPDKDGHRAGDLLDRDFTAPAPNLVWVADFPPHAGGAPTTCAPGRGSSTSPSSPTSTPRRSSAGTR